MKECRIYLLVLCMAMCRQPGQDNDVLFRTTGSSNGGDLTPPTAGASISFSTISTTSITVNWGAGSDNKTLASNLQYKLVKGNSASAIDTIEKIESITGPDLIQTYAANSLSRVVSSLTPSTTYYFAVAVKDEAGNSTAYSAVSAKTKPTLNSSTPSNGATTVQPCSAAPCTAKIVLVFSETMDTGLAQTLTTEIPNGNTSTWVSVPNTGTTFTWSTTTNTNDTLSINLSWKWFPENSLVRYTLLATGLKDLAGNSIPNDITQSFETTTANEAFALADTGQTLCYDTTTNVACTGTGGTYPNQDGDFSSVPNGRNFSGPTQHGTYTSDYTTADNVTTLVWKACSEGLSGASCAGGALTTLTWFAAVNQCAALNSSNGSAGYAGRTDWRLPTVLELKTLPNFGTNSPAIDTTNFPNTASGNYWTATAAVFAGYSSSAWVVGFNTGSPGGGAKSTTNYVRCVSAPTINQRNLTDNGNGTVTDARTNLVWDKSVSSSNTWAQALSLCKNSTLASRTWRLPSATEIMTIVDFSQINPAVNQTYYPGSFTTFYTSTTNPTTPTNSYLLDLQSGGLSSTGAPYVKTATNGRARCVSTGP